jgi:hypothetical protein
MPDEKKSPWLKKDQPHPADLPEEVYEQTMESDDAKLERALVAARLLDTPVPPANEYQTCRACADRVPLLFRDPLYGIPVCRECAYKSVLQEFLTKIEGVVGGVADAFAPDLEPDDTDDDEEPDLSDLPPEVAEALGAAGDIDGEDAPEVPQATSPSAVEAAGGGESKAEPEPETPQPDGEAGEAKPEDAKEEPPAKE